MKLLLARDGGLYSKLRGWLRPVPTNESEHAPHPTGADPYTYSQGHMTLLSCDLQLHNRSTDKPWE